MDDPLLASLDVPRDCEVVEMLYRLKHAEESYVDLTVAHENTERRLRFRGPRVVQFAKELPETLGGLEVRDVSARGLGGLGVWVSIGDGAVTFWAKDVVEQKPQPPPAKAAAAPRREGAAGDIARRRTRATTLAASTDAEPSPHAAEPADHDQPEADAAPKAADRATESGVQPWNQVGVRAGVPRESFHYKRSPSAARGVLKNFSITMQPYRP